MQLRGLLQFVRLEYEGHPVCEWPLIHPSSLVIEHPLQIGVYVLCLALFFVQDKLRGCSRSIYELSPEFVEAHAIQFTDVVEELASKLRLACL